MTLPDFQVTFKPLRVFGTSDAAVLLLVVEAWSRMMAKVDASAASMTMFELFTQPTLMEKLS